MANELRFTPTLQYSNGALKRTIMPGQLNLPQAVQGLADLVVSATTAEADVSVGLGTPGLAVLHNLEATTTGATWLYGLKSSTGGIPQYFRLPPKQMAVVNYGTSAMVLRGKALAGTLKVAVTVFEN